MSLNDAMETVDPIGYNLFGGAAADAARDGADAQLQGTREGIEFQREYLNWLQQISQPNLNISNQALQQLGSLYGMDTSYNPNPVDPLGGGGGQSQMASVAPPASAQPTAIGPMGLYQDRRSKAAIDENGNLLSEPGKIPPPVTDPAGQDPGRGIAYGNGRQWKPTFNEPAPSATDPYAAFRESPDYQLAMQEGQNALDRRLNAQGLSLSGRGVQETQRFADGLASQRLGNYQNMLAQMAGIGGGQTQNLLSSAQGATNAITNLAQAGGDARASGYINAANAQSQGVGNAATLGAAALSFFSDRRLKTNIRRRGNKHGLPWYEFDYVWGEHSEGHMADEVAQIYPDAVSYNDDGYAMVNYGALA